MALTTNQTAALEQLIDDIVNERTDLDARIVAAVQRANASRGHHPPGSVIRVATTRMNALGQREYAAELRARAVQAKNDAPAPDPAQLLAEAAERVREFLHERTRTHRGSEEIYSLGSRNGIVSLNHADLELLLLSVMPDADLGKEDSNVTRGRRAAAQELHKALSRGDVLAGEARSIEAQEKAEAEG